MVRVTVCLHPWHPVPCPSPQNAERKRTHFVWLSSRHGLFGSNVTKIGHNSFTLERTRQHRFRHQRVTNDSDPGGRFGVPIRLRHLNSGPPRAGTTPHSSFEHRQPNPIRILLASTVLSHVSFRVLYPWNCHPKYSLALVPCSLTRQQYLNLLFSSVAAFQNQCPLVTVVLGSAHCFSRIPGCPLRDVEPMT